MTRARVQRPQFYLIAGHVVECFDNTLYGFFAVMLAPLFFPSHSDNATILASYEAFFAGFIARPLGAFCFGHLGDRKGRKYSLLYSMAFVGLPTATIGLLPTYDTIGFAAPLILILCRLTQGFFMGGEFTGANLYISENFVSGKVGKGTGILIFSGVMGAVLVTLFGAVVTSQFMPSWAWRVPFILGGLSAYIVYYFRRTISETVDFAELDTEKLLKSPWKTLLKDHKLSMVVSSLIAGLTIIPLYCATVLGNKLFKELGYSPSECMILNTVAMVVDGFSILYFGYLADKIGFHRQMLLGIFLIGLVSIFAFYPLMEASPPLWAVLWYVLALIGSGSIINGCAMPYIASYFPTYCRFSGVALSVTLGHAIFGGTTPLVGSYLIDAFSSRIAPVYWVVTLSLITLLLMHFNEKPQYLKNLKG
jgi:MHS family proline/betaine transporter-like MFS transporter